MLGGGLGGLVLFMGPASGHQGLEGQGHHPRSLYAYVSTSRISGARQVLQGFWEGQQPGLCASSDGSSGAARSGLSL